MKKMIATVAALALAVPVPVLAAAAQIANIESVKVSPDSIVIRTDTPVKYNSFMTSVPPRLIVELLNSRSASLKSLDGAGTVLKRVRYGQYQSKPVSISRVVLDLSEKAAYDIVSSGSQLLVSLKGKSGILPGDLKDAPESAPLRGTVSSAEAKESVKDASAVSVEAAEDSDEKEIISEDVAAQEDSEAVAMAEEQPKPVQKILPSKQKKFYAWRTGDIVNSLPKESVSLDYDSADVRDILSWMASKAGFNIIYTNDVAGVVTLRLNNVPFDEAFKTVLNLKGLATEQVGNSILRIATPQVLLAERQQALPVTRIFSINYTKAEELKTQVDSVMSAEGRKGVTTADKNNNVLIVTDTPGGIETMARLIRQLDQRPKQVLIEAKLVEVSLNNSFNLGIQWSAYGADNGRVNGKPGINYVGSGTKLPDEFTGPLNPSGLGTGIPQPLAGGGGGTGVNLPASVIYGAFRFGRIASNYMFDSTLSAAAQKSKVKVLSDPKVATLNNKEATINITTQIPYTTTETTQTVPPISTTKVTYLTVGIMLTVTPTINGDGRVSLKIKPSVSQPSATIAAVAGGAPGIDMRSADTTVLIKDGETVVIGGLIHDSISEGFFKVPLLGDIPIAGWLLKKKTTSRDRMELLIFVTPRILEG